MTDAIPKHIREEFVDAIPKDAREELIDAISDLFHGYGYSLNSFAIRAGVPWATAKGVLEKKSSGQQKTIQKLTAAMYSIVQESRRTGKLTDGETRFLECARPFLGKIHSDTPKYTHPFAQLCVGHHLFFILVNYHAGYASGRETALHVFKNERLSNPNGTSLYDVFGDHDLLIRICLKPTRLQSLLNALRASDVPPDKIAVYRVGRPSTAQQREFDGDFQDLLTLDRTVIRHGDEWRINRPLQDAIRRTRNPALVKFFAFFWCDDYGRAVRVFRDLLASCDDTIKRFRERDEPPPFENHAVYSFTGEKCGCLLTGYTRNWQGMKPAFINLLKEAEISKLKSTTLIRASDEDIEDDRPSVPKLADSGITDPAILRLEAVLNILNVDEFATTEPWRDRFVWVFGKEDVGRAVTTYDPSFWWTYVDHLRELCGHIARGRNRHVLAFLMLAYTRMESELRKLLVAHHPKTTNGKLDERDRTYEILTDCGILEFDEMAKRAKEALTAFTNVREVKGLPKEVKHAIKTALRDAQRNFSELAKKDAHITLGVIPRIIDAFADDGVIPNELYDIDRHPEMAGWRDNLTNASADRNHLMHGDILDIYEPRDGDRAVWQRLLPNYVRAYPQVQWILHDMRENLKRRADATDAENATE